MKNIWKGLGLCAFLCMMTATPSRAEICFLPTGDCEQGAMTRQSEETSCQEYVDSGDYFWEDQSDENKSCSQVNVAGCSLWYCTVSTCQQRGYMITDKEKKAYYSDDLYNCESCTQGNSLWWKCNPRPCSEEDETGTLVKEKDANCPDGQKWVKAPESRLGCGKCEKLACPENTVEDVNDFDASCYTCHEYTTVGDTICYICNKMDGYIPTAEAEEMSATGCYTYEETERDSDNGEKCYKPKPLICPTDQYVLREEYGEGARCECRNYEYEFDAKGNEVENIGEVVVGEHGNTRAEKLLHYTAAGGTKVVNVISKRIGIETEDWEYEAPTSAGNCDIVKSANGATLTVSCPLNLTEEEITHAFTITQRQADTVTKHIIDFTIIIDPDTCVNPNDVEAGCSRAGFASYGKGPRPQCYPITLHPQCEKDGFVPVDSGHKSIAGQACYYCIDDNCPTAGYFKGETPAPAEGYLTEETDLGSNCYMEKPCPTGYSTEFPDVNACTKENHPEGWTFTSDGLCGSKVCGKCTPNTCTGNGRDFKCEAQPRCNDWNAKGCGYESPDVEYEGDTPKYNCNIRQCPEGTYTEKLVGCGKNVDSGYRSADKVCWQWSPMDTTCEGNFSWDGAMCKCTCQLECTGEDEALNADTCTCMKIEKPCDLSCTGNWELDRKDCECKCNLSCTAEDEELNAETCTCEKKEAPCTRGDGWFGSECCEDTDCYESSDFPLYCFNGKCAECDIYSTCEEFMTDSSRFKKKYGSNVKGVNRKARDENGNNVRYAGEYETIESYQEGYKNRYYCTGYGECSQCESPTAGAKCTYFAGNTRVDYICDGVEPGSKCYYLKDGKKTSSYFYR